MFYNTKIEIYDSPNGVLIKTIYSDVQPYSGTVNFDYGLSLDISNRVFCDISNEIDDNAYLKINGCFYKVLNIKAWSDYMDVYLYKCKRLVS